MATEDGKVVVGGTLKINRKRKSEVILGKPKRLKVEDTLGIEIYRKCSRLVISDYHLKTLDYPRPDPSGVEGKVKLYGDHYGFTEDGRQQPHGCCGRQNGSKGCMSAPCHVYKGNLYLDVEGFKTTQPRDPPADGNYGVYAIDTESIHTVKGLEVCKVTVIDWNLKVVYDEYCLPTTEIIDYNTIWSGITARDLEGVTKTFTEMREDLLKLFSKDTILVGHGLGSDLMVLKILHEKIIDTLIVYPHHRGLPLKRSLKDIALSVLAKSIQSGNGHDSKEDAEVTMQLVLRKVR